MKTIRVRLDCVRQESTRREFRSSERITEWESGRLISVGRYSLEVRERDTFFSGGDEILESVIDLERKHIFQFFNTGVIHFLFLEKYELSLLAKR